MRYVYVSEVYTWEWRQDWGLDTRSETLSGTSGDDNSTETGLDGFTLWEPTCKRDAGRRGIGMHLGQ